MKVVSGQAGKVSERPPPAPPPGRVDSIHLHHDIPGPGAGCEGPTERASPAVEARPRPWRPAVAWVCRARARGRKRAPPPSRPLFALLPCGDRPLSIHPGAHHVVQSRGRGGRTPDGGAGWVERCACEAGEPKPQHTRTRECASEARGRHDLRKTSEPASIHPRPVMMQPAPPVLATPSSSTPHTHSKHRAALREAALAGVCCVGRG